MKDSQRRANRKYIRRAYEMISFRARKEMRLNEQIEYAAARTGTSKADYMLNAILAALKADNISIDSLPAPSPDEIDEREFWEN